jgi:AraC-like DNA-binding protein
MLPMWTFAGRGMDKIAQPIDMLVSIAHLWNRRGRHRRMSTMSAVEVNRYVNLWPVPRHCKNNVVAVEILEELRRHVLTRDLYPVTAGVFRQFNTVQHHIGEPIRFPTTVYISGGAATCRIDGKAHELSTGSFVLVPPGSFFVIVGLPSGGCEFEVASFDGSLAAHYCERLKYAAQPVNIGSQPRLTAHYAELSRLISSCRTFDDMLEVTARIKMLIAHVAKLIADRRDSHGTDLTAIVALMRQQPEVDFDIDHLAASVSMSKFHFFRKFKNFTGSSPRQFLIRQRLLKACQDLTETDLPIGEIARRLGYEDALYFSRAFRKIVGRCPTSYRDTFRGREAPKDLSLPARKPGNSMQMKQFQIVS